MSPSAYNVITPELLDGEQMRWVGAPSLSAAFLHNVNKIVFGCLFAFAPVFFGGMQSANSYSTLYRLATVAIFFIIGGKIVYGSVLNVLLTFRTVYAVTDQRIIIVENIFRKRVIILDPKTINTLEYKSNGSGNGTVLFRLDNFNGLDASGVQKSGFRGVPDVLGAVEALNQLRRLERSTT